MTRHLLFLEFDPAVPTKKAERRGASLFATKGHTLETSLMGTDGPQKKRNKHNPQRGDFSKKTPFEGLLSTFGMFANIDIRKLTNRTML